MFFGGIMRKYTYRGFVKFFTRLLSMILSPFSVNVQHTIALYSCDYVAKVKQIFLLTSCLALCILFKSFAEAEVIS